MAKFVDFPIVYGKLGNHFGLTTGEQALALFQQAMKCPPGSLLVEYWPDGGRSTVILATAARNLDGKLLVFTNWDQAPLGSDAWFQRAYKTHRLEGVVEVDPPAAVGSATLTVVRGMYRPPHAGRLLVLGEHGLSNGHAPAERGPGWAVIPDYVPVASQPLAIPTGAAVAVPLDVSKPEDVITVQEDGQ